MAARKSSRVSKPRSGFSTPSKMTRSRSRLFTTTTASSEGNLRQVVDEVTHPRDDDMMRYETNLRADFEDKGIEVQADDEIFPFMELPAEIRLEIYRLCLTRPHKILLSKPAKPPQAQEEKEEDFRPPGAIKRALRSNSSSDKFIPVPGVNYIRLPTPPTVPTSSGSSSNASGSATNPPALVAHSNSTRTSRRPPRPTSSIPGQSENTNHLCPNILPLSKQIYQEARDVLYSENIFEINILTAVSSLSALHQRSRRQIKCIELVIPTYAEILERFSEIVRVSLRYCTGLRKFVIHTPFTLPGNEGALGMSNKTVYANGFDILRWLPQKCEVMRLGQDNPEIDAVIMKHMKLARTQDSVAYARRQLISNEADRPLEA